MQNKLAIAVALALATAGAYAGEQTSDQGSGATQQDTGPGGDSSSSFADMDKDGDGYISKAEAKQGQISGDQMARADKNQDQRLDKSEFSSYTAFKQNLKGGHPGGNAGDEGTSQHPDAGTSEGGQ